MYTISWKEKSKVRKFSKRRPTESGKENELERKQTTKQSVTREQKHKVRIVRKTWSSKKQAKIDIKKGVAREGGGEQT